MLLNEFFLDISYFNNSFFNFFIYLKNNSYSFKRLPYSLFFNLTLNLFFEFKSIKDLFIISVYKYYFIFYYILCVVPTVYSYNRLFHIGVHYYSFFIGKKLFKYNALVVLPLFSLCLYPTVGEHGWKYWVYSVQSSKILFNLLNLDIFGELSGHSGFYNVKGSLSMKVNIRGTNLDSLLSFLSCVKIFSKDIFLY